MKKTFKSSKTGDVAYVNMDKSTIQFSNSKHVNKATITKKPRTNKIGKITTSYILAQEEDVLVDSQMPDLDSDILFYDRETPLCLQTPSYIMGLSDEYFDMLQ